MVTLLDCINRVPEKVIPILENRHQTFASFFEKLSERCSNLDSIVIVGSGTSFSAGRCARGYIEKMTRCTTSVVLPNEFIHNTYVYPRNALYIYVSQTGTSTLTQEALLKMKRIGHFTVAVTEHDQTPLAQIADAHVEIGCGHEEYGMRTLGFCCSVLTLMLLGLEIGHQLGRVHEEYYDISISEVKRIPAQHRKVTELAMDWFDRNKEQLLCTDTFTIFGGDSLYGLAQEGALKILEISKHHLAIGYEADDGLHGPTMGLSPKNCVIALNDGYVDNQRMISLAKWAKAEMHNGFIVGANTLDDKDLPFDVICGDFKAIEFAPVVQVLAYRLAHDLGINIADRTRHKEKEYFITHAENK